MKLSYKNTRHPRVHVVKDTGFAEGVERTGVTQPASLILGLLLRVAQYHGNDECSGRLSSSHAETI